jgi:hypothetical protein
LSPKGGNVEHNWSDPIKTVLTWYFHAIKRLHDETGCKTEKNGLTGNNNMGGAHRPYQFEAVMHSPLTASLSFLWGK